ncbi:DNA polymerase II large subunit [Candidatus Pacearchaeota archaeon CG10_big_fil_rev_8_21_14_0_10_32_14]|nr:MAG: DNA polymerase II large subunit [Candidatus Pacearchaeota archaeon CG10_big_fil_rev_8_21_14_0_10_32_14]
MQSEKTQNYFIELEKGITLNYDIANQARALGLDPKDKVEIPLARSLAEKVVGLIATIYPQMNGSGIDKRILELEEEYGKLDTTVSFKIAEEVAKQKFCKFNSVLEAIDAGIRVGFSYSTLGVVSSPIEGFTQIKLGKTREGKEYFMAYFSGPIRSAGTTASCVVLMLIDYLRELFGYAKYDPTEDEIKRYVSENQDYHERITNLQYMPTEEEILFLAKNLPFQIAGEPTEKLEVSNHKNLERVDTNFIRGGMCLIFSEGLAQKAAKGFRLLNGAKKNGIKTSGFDFLEEYIKIHDKRKKVSGSDSSPTYIKDLVAGRPIFGHPSRSGGFRFRYGRARSSGFSAASLHPATMAVTDDFIAIGTQLKIEKPTKGCAISSCDSLEGPIVKLNNGSVVKLSNFDEARKLYPDIDEIIYLGDILFPYSDVANRNSVLINPGYVEEWWHLELEEASKDKAREINPSDISFEEACALSKKYELPLHPKFIFYWTQISVEEFIGLMDWLKKSVIRGHKIILPFTKPEEEKFVLGKRALELLGVEHKVTIENVVINEERSKALLANLGIEGGILDNEELMMKGAVENLVINKDMTIIELVNVLSQYKIKDLAGDFIGTRMGRPEKAKLRKLVGSPHVLFPVGSEGGRLRSIQAACEFGGVKSSFPLFYCSQCKKETIYATCEICKQKSEQMFYCPECKQKYFGLCSEHNEGVKYSYKELDINHYMESAINHLKLNPNELPILIKGIRGTSSADHVIENLAKGILRSHFNLQVNKDGTIRYDVTELPLTHFKPKEISASVEKLVSLGYTVDIHNHPLENDNQILELMPHDIILPCCPDSPDERADTVFLNVAKFIDALLERYYHLPPFYNVKTKEDLIGMLGVCMAPHNCAGVICRFIGFSNTQGGMASPYMHAAIRRDCDGDEMAIMLLLDVLLNFSLSFLPNHRGGTQDAPLVLNGRIDAGEVDDQILDLEMTMKYPLELYQLAEKRVHSSEVNIYTVKKCLRDGKDPFVDIGFTHDTDDFNEGVLCSSYKKFATMREKVDHQMRLVEKIRAVDTSDTAKLIIERHFIRDMRGNLRKFSMQQFRCVACNESIRRPPLTGVCPACGGKIIFTIHEGGIKKYLDPALELAEKYNLSPYIKQSLELTKRYIDSVFGKELEKQEALKKWF